MTPLTILIRIINTSLIIITASCGGGGDDNDVQEKEYPTEEPMCKHPINEEQQQLCRGQDYPPEDEEQIIEDDE